MNKNIKNSIWTVAIAIASVAMSLVACSSEDNETENSAEERPLVYNGLYAVTRGNIASTGGTLFTEDDIEWFDVNTRELRFKETATPLAKKLNPCEDIGFCIGSESLFIVSNLVNPVVSRTYFDLVLYEEITWQNDEAVSVGYFLYDCYPSQFIDAELTVINREKRATQWEAFLEYLDNKGKLRK